MQLAPNNKYWVYAIGNRASALRVVDAKTLKRVKDLRHRNQCQLLALEISPCSNYIMSVILIEGEPRPFLNIFEVATSKIVACSQITVKNFVAARWDQISIGSMEFVILSSDALQYWRLNARMQLEYIDTKIEEKQKQAYG